MASVLSSLNIQFLFVALLITLILGVALFFGWFYTLATHLHDRLPASATLNLMRFKLALFLPIGYLLLVGAFVGGVAFTDMPASPSGAVFVLLVPLHLLSMACMFYCLHFLAKTLKTVESQVTMPISECLSELFLFWFFPFGIWVLQPRINRIFSSEKSEALV